MLGARGGVLGVTAYAPFCETKPGIRPVLDDLVDHIEHVGNVIGIDHVGIGSDFFESESEIRFARFTRSYPAATGVYTSPARCTSRASNGSTPPAHRGAGATPVLDQDVLKILGGNFLRVFRQAWG